MVVKILLRIDEGDRLGRDSNCGSLISGNGYTTNFNTPTWLMSYTVTYLPNGIWCLTVIKDRPIGLVKFYIFRISWIFVEMFLEKEDQNRKWID